LDEKSGKEIKSNQIILTSADNLRDAYDSVNDLFGSSTDDHEIIELVYSPIMEIFPFYMKEKTVETEAVTEKVVDEYVSEEV
jgi:hypothetical protein